MNQLATSRAGTTAVLLLQFIPLILFPADSFSPQTQEWWLPAILAVLVIFADVELIVRRSHAIWPWNLMSFAQGFNIISRLMMIWPHATVNVGSATVLNTPYILLTLLSILLSAFLLIYLERPEVRMSMA